MSEATSKKDHVNRPVQIFDGGTYATQMLAPTRKPNPELLTSTFWAYVLTRNNVQSLRPKFAIISVENFRTIVIHSRNEILGGYDIDRLGPLFLGFVERIFCSFVKRSRFSNDFVNKSSSKSNHPLATKTEAKKAGSANFDADKTPRPLIASERFKLTFCCIFCGSKHCLKKQLVLQFSLERDTKRTSHFHREDLFNYLYEKV